MRITKPQLMSPSAGMTMSSVRGSGLIRYFASSAHFVIGNEGGPGSR
jgi:hypothetical protein